MLTKSYPAPINQGQAAGDCRCGCAPCDKHCCDLECLVRPRFFCGQLLTDADLTALVEWSRARFRLTRHRHGWGVICGLEVSRDPQNPAGVLIHPGYAIDCCGNDIVVCKPCPYNLANVCPRTECSDPRTERRQALEQARRRAEILINRVSDLTEEQQKGLEAEVQALQEALKYEDLERLRAAIEALEAAGKRYDDEFDRPEHPGLFGEQLNNAQAVDLFLHYDEQGAEPQTALRAGACGAGECQDSRVYEGHRLSRRIVLRQAAPSSDWDNWRARYAERLAAAANFVEQVRNATDIRPVCAILTSWLNDPSHTPGQFCFARDRGKAICANVTRPDDNWERDLREVVFWLIVDDLIAGLACDCASCDPADGIPLARVWLRGSERGQPCRIVAIDNQPPYRRPLRSDDCLPARPNQVTPDMPGVNLGDLLGRRWEDVQHELRARGFEGVECQDINISSQDWEGVETLLRISPESLTPYSNTQVVALCVELGSNWGRRVVGFRPLDRPRGRRNQK